MSVTPNTCVLKAPGINCNEETGYAFEQFGAHADQVHISQLTERVRGGEHPLDDYQILALSGGFSHSDHIASGRVLGLELRTVMAEELNRFIDAGKAIVGICNGFQVLVESGLLPDGRIEQDRRKQVSLSHNENDKFECRSVGTRLTSSVSKLLTPADYDKIVQAPVAHREGRFTSSTAYADQLINDGQVFLEYCDPSGETTDYPHNPNGSERNIAGICDPTGLISGMMPHPERPEFVRGQRQLPLGSIVFKNLVAYAMEM